MAGAGAFGNAFQESLRQGAGDSSPVRPEDLVGDQGGAFAGDGAPVEPGQGGGTPQKPKGPSPGGAITPATTFGPTGIGAGAGPIGSKLVNLDFTKGTPFLDGGALWSFLPDEDGNLLTVRLSGYDQAGPTFFFPGGPSDALIQGPDFFATFYAQCEANMAQFGWKQSPGAELVSRGKVFGLNWSANLYIGTDGVMHDRARESGEWQDASGLPGWDEYAYVTGVRMTLPVSEKDKAAGFDGKVWLLVNVWTGQAIIVGLRTAIGTGDLLWKTLLGYLQVIVGVIGVATGNVAGLTLIFTGFATVVGAWWDFQSKVQKQVDALNRTLDPAQLRKMGFNVVGKGQGGGASSGGAGWSSLPTGLKVLVGVGGVLLVVGLVKAVSSKG